MVAQIASRLLAAGEVLQIVDVSGQIAQHARLILDDLLVQIVGRVRIVVVHVVGSVRAGLGVRMRDLAVDGVCLLGHVLLVVQRELQRAQLLHVQHLAVVFVLGRLHQVTERSAAALVLDQLDGVLPGLVANLAVQLLEAGAVQAVLVERRGHHQEVERFVYQLTGVLLQVVFNRFSGARQEAGVRRRTFLCVVGNKEGGILHRELQNTTFQQKIALTNADFAVISTEVRREGGSHQHKSQHEHDIHFHLCKHFTFLFSLRSQALWRWLLRTANSYSSYTVLPLERSRFCESSRFDKNPYALIIIVSRTASEWIRCKMTNFTRHKMRFTSYFVGCL
uniref:Uncharacterized protein n=1 Tax=Anopheles atroparvus TaxID=41427 RepID=A0AAG5CS75_ANOAO